MTLQELMEAALQGEEHFSPEELKIAQQTEYFSWLMSQGEFDEKTDDNPSLPARNRGNE